MIQDTDHFGLGVSGVWEACNGIHAVVLDVLFEFLIHTKEVGPLGNFNIGWAVAFATAFQEGLDAISFGGSLQLKGGVDFRGRCIGPIDVGDLTHLNYPLAKAIPLASSHPSWRRLGDCIGVDRTVGGIYWGRWRI